MGRESAEEPLDADRQTRGLTEFDRTLTVAEFKRFARSAGFGQGLYWPDWAWTEPGQGLDLNRV